MKVLLKSMGVLIILFILINAYLVARFYLGQQDVVRHNEVLAGQSLELPAVERLEITPVIELLPGMEGVKTEPGLSLLVKTEQDNILFDVGYNKDKAETSPLLHNLELLNVHLDDIEAIAISHNHPDHVGGMGFRNSEVMLSGKPLDLKNRNVFTPVSMSCATANPVTVDKPQLVGDAVASTGPQAVQVFVTGKLLEQALLINVKDKGLVVVSGCGHPNIVRTVEMAQEITGLPVYAVVGGLHLYYTDIPAGVWGNIMGSSRLFSRSPSREEVVETVRRLKELGIQKAFISPHDSDQPTLQIFSDQFGDDYSSLKVGQKVTI